MRSPEGLRLAAPFVALLAASLVAWPWFALGLPGAVGGLPPPSVALLVLVVLAGARAMAKRLPLGLLTWPPAGLSALFFLMGGYASGSLDPEAAPLLIVGYLIVLLFALIVAMALVRHGLFYSVSFLVLFLMATFAIPVTIFEAERTVSIPHPTLLTTASVVRALLEVAATLWLAARLVFRAGVGTSTATGMVALAVAHGPLVAWEISLRAGASLTLTGYATDAGQWALATLVQVGIVLVLSRLRRGWGEAAEVFQEPPRISEAPAPEEPKQIGRAHV